MQLLPKWAQNVSKFILFHKCTAIFKLNINFQFFYQFFLFLKCFLPISHRLVQVLGCSMDSKYSK